MKKLKNKFKFDPSFNHSSDYIPIDESELQLHMRHKMYEDLQKEIDEFLLESYKEFFGIEYIRGSQIPLSEKNKFEAFIKAKLDSLD